ncbi:hypothetical protein N9J07_00285 [Bacteroidia bacterium]|nr:hypothetical protein [Bacteroidia bacterium]
MSRYILTTLSSLLLLWAYAQDTTVLAKVSNITSFSIDSKGNTFAADDNLSLYKFDAKGSLITNVNIKSYGEITSIDCSNPFEIYVYHQDQNIVVFYDNMLNQRGEIRLNDYYYYNVACVARSFDNHLWVMDLSQYQLIKINKQGKRLAESPYLNNITGKKLSPFKMWEQNNDVYLADSTNGVYKFDMYATYATTYFHPKLTNALSIKTNLILVQDTSLLFYNTLLRNPLPLDIHLPANVTLQYYDRHLVYAIKNRLIRLKMP